MLLIRIPSNFDHSEIESDTQTKIFWDIIMLIISANLLVFIFVVHTTHNETKYLRNLHLNTTYNICNRTQYINEFIYIEKKIVFYDIRQHLVGVDFKSETNREFLDVLQNTIGNTTRPLMFDYWSKINSINSSVFQTKSDDLIIQTNDNFNYSYELIHIITYRNDNIGYTINRTFIEELSLKGDKPFDKNVTQFLHTYEIDIMKAAYYLHNTFYKKLKREYRTIENKYNSLPDNFTDFDKVMIELSNREREMDILEDFDSKKRNLQIREMQLLLTN